jgi:hypothetical protein
VNHTQFFVFASYLLRELRGFAPIGILEYWNDGFSSTGVNPSGFYKRLKP